MKEFPKKFIYGRIFRVKLKKEKISVSNVNISFYNFGIKALEIGKLQVFHIKAIMKTIKKFFKKELNLRLNVSFVIPVTKKPLESRMGKGKAQRDYWEASIQKGQILIEFGGELDFDKIKKCFKLVIAKFPFKTKLVRLMY